MRAVPGAAALGLRLRVTNDRHIVTLHYSADGVQWRKFDVQMETSGYHHNVAGDFLSLRPAIYARARAKRAFAPCATKRSEP